MMRFVSLSTVKNTQETLRLNDELLNKIWKYLKILQSLAKIANN